MPTAQEQPDQIIAAIRDLLKVDALKALCDLIRAEHRARAQNWGAASRIQLRSLRAELAARKTDLLYRINQNCQEQGAAVEGGTSSTALGLDNLVPSPRDGGSPDAVDEDDVQLWQRQLKNKKENLRLIQERVTEYVLSTDIPLQILKEESQCKKEIQELEQHLTIQSGAYDEPEPLEGLAQELLAVVALFRNESLGQHLAAIRPILTIHPTPEPVNDRQIVAAACWLWDHYNQITRALVVTVFVWVSQQSDLNLHRQVEAAFGANRQLRRLATDPALCQWLTIQKFAAPDYQWPGPNKVARPDRLAVAEFLKQTGFTGNPFWSGAAKFDSLLFTSYTHSQCWEEITHPRPSLLTGHETEDRARVQLLLRHEVQRTTPQRVFSIWCELSNEFGLTQRPMLDYLSLVANGSAQTWLDFLPFNAGVWFGLSDQHKHSLAHLLAWHTHSGRRLIDRLYEQGFPEDAEAKAVKEELTAILDKVTLADQPDETDFLRWLAVRPPGLEYTYALIDCSIETPDGICTAWGILPRLSDKLLESDVILKIFIAESIPIGAAANIDSIVIEWEDKNLISSLDKRIQLQCAPDRSYATFADLFFPDPRATDATRLLVETAHGSLSRLQHLGQRVIDAHVSINADQWDYDILEQTIYDAR